MYYNRKSSVNINLFIVILFFILWVLNNLFQWLTFNIILNLTLARIATFQFLALLFFLYFVYALVDKNINWKKKALIAVPFIPFLLLFNSDWNVYSIGQKCDTMTGPLYYYGYSLCIIYILWSIGLLFRSVKNNLQENDQRKKAYIVSSAVSFLAIWCVAFVILSNYFAQSSIGDQISYFIPIGFLIFIGMLVYAISKYQLLNIKLIGAQALVLVLIILVGSQFFFADNTTSMILTGITMALSLGFGYMLIKSVGAEVERKEELQKMADSLAVANDKLRILDKAKTEFISIASHQLRTPVTAIKGFSSLLLEGSYGEVSATVKGALEKVYVSSERLVNLIEDLLNVSRIESGRLTFTFEMGSVNDILQELYDSFILVAKSKKFYLDLKVPETPFPKIKMDAAKVRELISNFIDNAFKYTEKGGVTVTGEIRESGVVIDENGFVKEGEKSPYGKVVRVTVSDTGIGVPKEEIPNLFKKFSRGKDVSRLHVGGTGLGLFVGKAIADAHHGATWVESDGEGKGSRFIIEIPIEAQV